MASEASICRSTSSSHTLDQNSIPENQIKYLKKNKLIIDQDHILKLKISVFLKRLDRSLIVFNEICSPTYFDGLTLLRNITQIYLFLKSPKSQNVWNFLGKYIYYTTPCRATSSTSDFMASIVIANNA